MTFGDMMSQLTGIGVTERLYGHHASPSNKHFSYSYDAPVHGHGHVATSKHSYGGKKKNGAMSALTLLAFLFFLHILQQCLKDHMQLTATPQVMIMSAAREDEINLNYDSTKKDKSGEIDSTEEPSSAAVSSDESTFINSTENKDYWTNDVKKFMEIPTTKYKPKYIDT